MACATSYATGAATIRGGARQVVEAQSSILKIINLGFKETRYGDSDTGI